MRGIQTDAWAPHRQHGFGVWQVADTEVDAAIAVAVETGYRSIDPGRLHGNDVGVGRALEATDLAPEDLFVATMVWNDDHGFPNDETGEFPPSTRWSCTPVSSRRSCGTSRKPTASSPRPGARSRRAAAAHCQTR